jgi:multidrug resistance protein
LSRPLLLLCGTGFLVMLGLGVLFPVLGFFTRDLGLGDFQAGVLISSYAFASFVASPFWGRFSDRHGRRPSILIGLLGFALAFGLFALGRTFEELLAARLFGGLLSAAAMPSVMAYAADSSDPSQRSRAIGMVGASFGLGVVAGPAVGAFVADSWGLRAPFFLASAIGLFSAGAVWALLPESLTPALQAEAASRREALAAQGMTRSRLVASLSPWLGFSFLMQTSRMALEGTVAFLVADRLRGDVRDVGMLLVGAGLAAAAVQGGGIRGLTRVFSDRSIMIAGTLMACVGMAGLALDGGWAWLIASVLVLALGSALQLPTFTAELSRKAEQVQGEAQGLNTSAQSLGRVVGPLLFTALYQASGTAIPYLVSAALVVVALGIVRLGMPSQPASGPASD